MPDNKEPATERWELVIRENPQQLGDRRYTGTLTRIPVSLSFSFWEDLPNIEITGKSPDAVRVSARAAKERQLAEDEADRNATTEEI